MNQPLHQFFSLDHRRLEELLERAIQDPLAIDKDLYHQFRVGLLTHIKMEENILFPAAMKANNNQPIPLAAKLRLDHGAITSMMAVPPTMELIKVLKIILDQHDILEEEPGGMYEICERLTEAQTDELLEKLQNITPVPLHPVNEAHFVLGAAIRALERAGYDYETLKNS